MRLNKGCYHRVETERRLKGSNDSDRGGVKECYLVCLSSA